MAIHTQEVASGQRFEFGTNWSRFLEVLNEDRIVMAESSLKDMLGVTDLAGKRFLDIGSGSGLFSLAARRLGASVFSFDYDPKSAACARELKARFFSDDPDWTIDEGSVLDRDYLAGLGKFDVVYSWGVLHHTGAMWQALKNVIPLVEEKGQLFIAIYNYQPIMSNVWLVVKRWYNRCPDFLRLLLLCLALIPLWGPRTIFDLLRGRPFATWRYYSEHSHRGMSVWSDLVDWVGGYPFEVAKPEQIFDFYRAQGFMLERLQTCGGGLGCNQFVFSRP